MHLARGVASEIVGQGSACALEPRVAEIDRAEPQEAEGLGNSRELGEIGIVESPARRGGWRLVQGGGSMLVVSQIFEMAYDSRYPSVKLCAPAVQVWTHGSSTYSQPGAIGSRQLSSRHS